MSTTQDTWENALEETRWHQHHVLRRKKAGRAGREREEERDAAAHIPDKTDGRGDSGADDDRDRI
jgi:hypothetical protein